MSLRESDSFQVNEISSSWHCISMISKAIIYSTLLYGYKRYSRRARGRCAYEDNKNSGIRSSSS